MRDFLVKINAGNDRNGNPRRGWIHYRELSKGDEAVAQGFYNEGYEGKSALPVELRTLAGDAEEKRVSVREYVRWNKARN